MAGGPPHPEDRSIVQEVGGLAETEVHHPDISFGRDCLSEHREGHRTACKGLRHGEWLLDRPDRSLDVKQRSYHMN